MASTSSTSSTAFTGNSSFSADLQNAINRAVGFASLPIQLLQNKQNDATNQQTALASLSSKFQSLQNSLDALNSSVGNGSYAATLSNTAVGSAVTSSGVTAGHYSLNVISTGTHANTMSTDNLTVVSDPANGDISSATNFTLTVDGQSFAISNSSGNLNGLAAAINASAANVQATVVNVGGGSSPDYRLSVQGTKYAATSIQLSDGANSSLLSTISPGSNVMYQVNNREVNGQPAIVSSDSRSIALAPSLTVNVIKADTTEIDVAQSTSGVSDALTSFTSAYNAVVDELAKSRGQSAGALSGNSIVYALQDNLRQLINSGVQSGSISSVSDLGLTFDQTGHLSFDPAALSKATSSSLTNVLSFLGTESSGGFLKGANDILTGIENTTTGTLPTASASLKNEISSLAKQISAKQDRVALLQQTLTAQMSKADAMISSLQQQVTYFTTLFTTMRTNNSANG
jgi:flagellar hook-associated protein 2